MKKAGINVLAGFDLDEKAGRIYELNNKPSKFYKKDIANLTGDDILELMASFDGKKILSGCAPCQPFSRINKDMGKNHKDYSLLDQFSRLILETKPDGVIMENVVGLVKYGKPVFKRFLKALRAVGLKATYENGLDVANYGVPQHRKRLVLVAARDKPILPEKTHGPGTGKDYVTVFQAIGKLPIIEAGHRDTTTLNHSCKVLAPINIIRIGSTPHNGGSRTDLPVELWIDSHKTHRGHGDTYGRMNWDKPSPTLTCRCLTISNGRFGHPEQNRGISVREAAILQGFPLDYVFPESLGDAQKCIGNAVPPTMAEIISRALVSSLTIES